MEKNKNIRLLCLILAGTSLAFAGEKVLFDLDLTKGKSVTEKSDITLIGGEWDDGWRVTEHGQRIILDAGKTIANGVIEAWFTKKGSAVNEDKVKAQWLSLHESGGGLGPEYLQLRSGTKGYGFTKIRMKSNEKAVSKKSGALTNKRCEVKFGKVEDWFTDDKTVMHVKVQWKEGLVTVTTPDGKAYDCTHYWQFPAPYIMNSLRFAYLGSDETQDGGSLPGLRFKRVRFVDLGGKAVKPETGNEFGEKTTTRWSTVEWRVLNPSDLPNHFDLIADVTFTHTKTGETRKTQMFYDGNPVWKFRFTATQTGEWTFVTQSADPDLNGFSGTVIVNENPRPDANGFITQYGSKWGWQGSETVFTPQYVMGKDIDYFYDLEADTVNTKRIEQEIREFVEEHGFTGFHLNVQKKWFDITGKGPFENPDTRTYQVLETIFQRVHEEGGACHLWMWGSDGPRDKMDGSGPRGVLGAPGNEKDLRNLRYMAARLGPLPGWSIGYGIDTENGVATKEQLNQWKNYLEAHFGWDHYISARVGYDEKGLWALKPRPPRPPKDENYCSPICDKHTFWLGGDYIGYTSYRPLYDRYLEAIKHRPEKPSFEEDRFRLRNLDKWTYKDYNPELTRRGLWHSTLAGGVANIWGHLLPDKDHGGSHSYSSGVVDIKHQIKTYSEFFKNRYLKEMQTFKLTDPVVLGLKTPDMRQVVFYQEETDEVTLDLNGLPESLPAIAVDTHKPYKEIQIGSLDEKDTVWKAPYKSDWAIAVGKF